MLRFRPQYLASGFALLALAGCGSSSHAATSQLSPKVKQELRYAEEQATLKCKPGTAPEMNPHSLRRECVRQTSRQAP